MWPARESSPLPVLVLFDEHTHTDRYVIDMTRPVFGHTEPTGKQIAIEVDRHGSVIVWTRHREPPELYGDQMIARGRDPLLPKISNGPMAVALEEVAE